MKPTPEQSDAMIRKLFKQAVAAALMRDLDPEKIKQHRGKFPDLADEVMNNMMKYVKDALENQLDTIIKFTKGQINSVQAAAAMLEEPENKIREIKEMGTGNPPPSSGFEEALRKDFKP